MKKLEILNPLILESKVESNRTIHLQGVATNVMVSPNVSEDYWAYRVRLTRQQSVVAFPKYSTIGIGMAKEVDWNSNLPWTCKASKIWKHIRHNKRNKCITDKIGIKAIRMIQKAIKEDQGDTPK